MAPSVLGIHHVTAIAGDPQQNIDFYTQVLGLRLVKVTVDVHDPEAYHLFYGAGTDRPGTLLTFHCWPGAVRGRPGTGQVHSTELGVPPGSLEFWHERLKSQNVQVGGLHRRDGMPLLSFCDPDGLELNLVADDAVLTWEAPVQKSISVDRAIRGLDSITIWADSSTEWERFLVTVLGLDTFAEDAYGRSYGVQGGSLGARVVIRVVPEVGKGLTTVGYVHHAAFRVPDHELDHWRSRLEQYTDTLCPLEDHVYHRALNLEGPEGVRLELASDGPGVSVDEAPAELGTHLVLPLWLESQRPYLERQLLPLRLPGAMR
ncbi:MAG TPA: VOC family protein [Chloroflexota bacterium]